MRSRRIVSGYVFQLVLFPCTTLEEIQFGRISICIDSAYLILHGGKEFDWRTLRVSIGQRKSMQVEIVRSRLGTRGEPVFRSPLAQASIRRGDDEEAVSHQIAAFATSFRHSVLASEAASARQGRSREH